MASELEELRARSAELAERLADDEALEVNAALLDLVPGDAVATNRLGIGLLKHGRAEEAKSVLENGLLVHPDNKIMRARLEEAERMLAGLMSAPGVAKKSTARRVAVVGWTDFAPDELVEGALAGPGRDACIQLCAASIRASEAIDVQRTAVTPIKQGRRFRTIGGIFTGVGPWQDTLTVAVPTGSNDVIAAAREAGGYTLEPAKAVPSVQLAVPRAAVERLYDRLLKAHVEHLRPSIEFGPPTHLNKHSPALREYILGEADLLDPR